MSNTLQSVHPELVSEWSDKNLPLTSDKITFGSNKRVWWKGSCGHEWQASVKARSGGEKCPICHLAFNLWNGFTEEGKENLFTPDELFCCGYAPYFMEGIKLRYPEYCRDLTPPKRKDMER